MLQRRERTLLSGGKKNVKILHLQFVVSFIACCCTFDTCLLDLIIEEEEENRKEGKAYFRFTGEEEPKDEIRCVAKREMSKAHFSLYTKL